MSQVQKKFVVYVVYEPIDQRNTVPLLKEVPVCRALLAAVTAAFMPAWHTHMRTHAHMYVCTHARD